MTARAMASTRVVAASSSRASRADASATFLRKVLDEVLLASQADPNICSAGGKTPLMGACMNGHAAIVRLLVVAGADQSLVNEFGETAIRRAAERGHQDCVDVLHGELRRRRRGRASRLAVLLLLLLPFGLASRAMWMMWSAPAVTVGMASASLHAPPHQQMRDQDDLGRPAG